MNKTALKEEIANQLNLIQAEFSNSQERLKGLIKLTEKSNVEKIEIDGLVKRQSFIEYLKDTENQIQNIRDKYIKIVNEIM